MDDEPLPAAPGGAVAEETPPARTRRARRLQRVLAEVHPDAACALAFTTPLELAVATVLSAQCTDARVNAVTPTLFARYPDAAAYAAADVAELEDVVRPTGTFRTKARRLTELGAALVERHGGEVPSRPADLVALPGFGRKTAAVVAGDAFGLPGVTVDTHVGRLARRWGLTAHDDPDKVQADLQRLWPKSGWTAASHRTIFHGRRVCHARTPACGVCPVARWCPSSHLGPADPDAARRLVRRAFAPALPADEHPTAPDDPAGLPVLDTQGLATAGTGSAS